MNPFENVVEIEQLVLSMTLTGHDKDVLNNALKHGWTILDLTYTPRCTRTEGWQDIFAVYTIGIKANKIEGTIT